MKYLVDAYVAAPASGGNILKTLDVEADNVTFEHGTALFTKTGMEPDDTRFSGASRRTVLVRAFAPEIWTQVRTEPEIARMT